MTPGRFPHHAVIAESSARLKTLVDHVYFKYAGQGMKMDARAGMGTLVLPPSTGEVLTYVRYLATELDDFAGTYARHRGEIEGALGGGDLRALHSLVGDQAATAGLVRDIRAALGDDTGLTLGELGSRVSPDQLEHILLHTRLVIESQDRLTGENMGEGGLTRREWSKILDVPKPRSIDQACALRDERARGFPGLDMKRHLRACSIMYERWDGMRKLCEMLDDCLAKFEKDLNFPTLRLTWASYMIKYVVMDLADFGRQHGTLGLDGREGFAQNRERYEAIYGEYFAEKAGREGLGAARLVRDEPGILTTVLDDAEEAGFFIDLIRSEFARAYKIPSKPWYDPDLAGINRKFDRICARAAAGGAGPGEGEALVGIAAVFGRPAG